ncbi:MAG TPA: hypothetical protein VFQ53_17275 [Kofleriaceae bacterium]|nr:hypothetical protein [Kofleriaceae bacterium]
MRTAVLVAVVLSLAAAPAFADVVGVYNVKFEEVSTNCSAPLTYPHGKLTITQKGNTVSVDIDRTPLMTGVPQKNGKVSAKSKLGATMIEGMMGVFSVAGRVTPEGQLHLVMVGEYSTNGKPLCTQSWNVTGPRSDTPPSKKSSSKTTAPSRASALVHDREDGAVMHDLVGLSSIGR